MTTSKNYSEKIYAVEGGKNKMEIWKEILITVLASILGGGGIAGLFISLYVKDIARKVLNEKLEEKLKNYTTKEDMQIERKELLEEVERKFLTLAAFREFEKRMENNFKDSAKRFDKLDNTLEHITDLIIQQR